MFIKGLVLVIFYSVEVGSLEKIVKVNCKIKGYLIQNYLCVQKYVILPCAIYHQMQKIVRLSFIIS